VEHRNKEVFKYSSSSGTFVGTNNHKVLVYGDRKEIKDTHVIDTAQGPVAPISELNPQTIMDGIVFGDGGIHKASGNLVILYIGSKDTDYHTSEVKELIKWSRSGINKYAWK